MQFDLRRFFRYGQKPFHTELAPDLSGQDLAGCRTDGPVRAAFDAATDGTRLELTLCVDAALCGECARCLDPVEEKVSFTRQWSLRERDLDDPWLELPTDPDGKLELEDLVYQELYIEAPRVLLCAPNCPGLCPVCGKKKTAGCTCITAEDTAPENGLQALKILLNDERV